MSQAVCPMFKVEFIERIATIERLSVQFICLQLHGRMHVKPTGVQSRFPNRNPTWIAVPSRPSPSFVNSNLHALDSNTGIMLILTSSAIRPVFQDLDVDGLSANRAHDKYYHHRRRQQIQQTCKSRL